MRRFKMKNETTYVYLSEQSVLSGIKTVPAVLNAAVKGHVLVVDNNRTKQELAKIAKALKVKVAIKQMEIVDEENSNEE